MMYYVTEWSNIHKDLKNRLPTGYKSINSKYYFDKIKPSYISYLQQEEAVRKINELSKNDLNWYKFNIPKKSGGYRVIHKPSDELKEILLTIKELFERLNIPPSDEAFAYVEGRSTFMCRQKHADNQSKWFLNIDIEDFFGSCNPNLVVSEITNLYPIYFFSDDRKKQLTDLLRAYCFLNDGLPQGSPVSPLLSNLTFIRYDYEIKRFLNKISQMYYKEPFIYTRYADDIEISSKVKFDPNLIIDGLKKILNPFKIKDKKTKFGNNNVIGVWGLGILYNNANQFSLGREYIDDLEHDILNMITYSNQGLLYDVRKAQQSLGNINYFTNINNQQVENILNKFKKRFNFDVIKFLKKSINQK